MRPFFTALTALLLGTALFAGSPPESKWTFGVNGSVSKATSPALKEVTNSKGALGAGLSVTYKVAPKQAVRVRSDYTGFPTYTQHFISGYALSTKANLWTGEVDYLYFPTKKVYLQAGYGVSQWQNQYYGQFPPSFGRKAYLQDADVKQPLVTVGAGYQIPVNKWLVKNVALEARLLSTQFAGSANSNTVQAGAIVSF